MSKKEKLINAAVSLFLVAAVILCITVVGQTLSNGYVTLFGRSLFRVVTGSMEPTIATDSLLISKEMDIREIKKDDIICFRSKESNMLGQVITHRVVEIQYGEKGEVYLKTRGDANPTADGYYVSEDNFIGKVVTYTKEGNFFATVYSIVTTPVGFLACIVFPVLLIAGFIMQESVNGIRKEMATLSRQMEETVSQPAISEAEYEAMVERLKKEILEEVKHSVEETGEYHKSENE